MGCVPIFKNTFVFVEKYTVHLIYSNQKTFLNWSYQFSHLFSILPSSPRREEWKPEDSVGPGCGSDRMKPRLQGGASELKDVIINAKILMMC
jgi:hypothetical protein